MKNISIQKKEIEYDISGVFNFQFCFLVLFLKPATNSTTPKSSGIIGVPVGIIEITRVFKSGFGRLTSSFFIYLRV